MAVPATGNRLNTITYPRGTVTAPRGLLEYVFGPLKDVLTWEEPGTVADPQTGRRRRIYGTKQRSSARAGQNMVLHLDNGEKYRVRVTGAHLDFVSNLLGRMLPGKVVLVTSERGTEYGPQARGNTR
jgi:hypothetical protein